MSTVVYDRHLRLRVPIELGAAVEPASTTWILNRAATYLDEFAPGGSAGTRIITRRSDWMGISGDPAPLPHNVWANVNRARGVDYLDDPRKGTPEDPFLLFLDVTQLGLGKGFAESVIAHEVTHLRFKTLGHGERFFVRVQEALFAMHPLASQAFAPTVASILEIVAPHLTPMVDSPK